MFVRAPKKRTPKITTPCPLTLCSELTKQEEQEFPSAREGQCLRMGLSSFCWALPAHPAPPEREEPHWSSPLDLSAPFFIKTTNGGSAAGALLHSLSARRSLGKKKKKQTTKTSQRQLSVRSREPEGLGWEEGAAAGGSNQGRGVPAGGWISQQGTAPAPDPR